MTIMPWTGPGPNPEQPWGSPQGLLGPRRRGGLFGASASIPQQPAMTAAPQPMAPKQSFFGEGGVGRAIAGNIGDFLLQYSGMQPIYAPIMQQRQAAQAAERERQQGLADWVAKQEYEATHRPPPNNDTINDYNFISQQLGEDAAKNYLRVLSDGPPVAVDVANPDGSVTRQFIPRSQMQGGGMVAPQAPVGKLKPYGGQSVAPTGNFR